MRSLPVRLLISAAAFAVGGLAGLFIPAFAAQIIGYGTGSYEDVLFIWFVTVPGGAALAAAVAWSRTRPALDVHER